MRKLPLISNWLTARPGMEKIFTNTGWLIVDRVVRLGVGLFVSAWMASYLGPKQFGLLNYAVALSALFGSLATLGLDKIVVGELVKHPDRQNAILGSVFLLKFAGGALSLVVVLSAVSLIRPGEILTLWLVGITSAGLVFQSLNVIDFYFQAHVLSKFSVYATNAAFLAVAVVKIALLVRHAPLIAFAATGLLETALAVVLLAIAYRWNRQSINAWTFDRSVAGALLLKSWPLIISGLAIMLYMRIDQIMLGQMLGDREVGIYSAAVRISEVWFFVPLAIANSFYPSIINSRKNGEADYSRRLARLMDGMAMLGFGVAVLFTLTSPYIVRTLYGALYADAASVLSLHVWAGLFVCLGVVSTNWLIVENLQKISLYRSVSGALVNIALNWFMIPAYGVMGAAFSTVIAQAVASVLVHAVFEETRPVFKCQMKSLFLHGLVPGRK